MTESVELPILEAPRTVRACLFGLGGALFAVEVRHAREVVVLEEFTVVPLAPSHLLGLTNLRGYILPIVDVRPLLGLRAQPGARGARLLVLDGGGGQVGVAVDSVQALQSFERIIPLGDGDRRRYGEVGLGAVERDGRLATLLDVPKVLQALHVGDVGERGETG